MNRPWLDANGNTFPYRKLIHVASLKARIGWQSLRTDEFVDEGPYCVTGTDFQNGKVNWSTAYHVSDERYEMDQNIQLADGDLLVTKDGTIGKVAVVRDMDAPATLNSGVFVVRPKTDDLATDFLGWVVRSKVFDDFVAFNFSGSTINHLYQNVFETFRFPFPDLSTQREIADFLDRETARIDLLIEKKQKLVALLGEKYKAEKKHLVFDLANHSVKRRASKVSWFPDLPRHWRFMRCAHIFKNLDHRRIPLSAEQRGDLAKIYPYYGASGIIDAVDDYLFDEDTILVGEDGANLVMQSTPIAFKATGKYWVNNHAHILTPCFGNFDFWIHALNQVPYEVVVTGSAQPKLTSAVLGNIRLPVPPTNEQTEITVKIEAMENRVKTAIEPIRTSITRLKEYRSALITAAVTGQIDVTTYAKSGTTDRRLDAIQEEMGA